MADKQNIKLRIGNKDYELGIAPEKEEVYRLAALEIHKSVAKYKEKSPSLSIQDCLALVALGATIEKISMRQSREVGNEDVKDLTAISERISEYMNRLEKV